MRRRCAAIGLATVALVALAAAARIAQGQQPSAQHTPPAFRRIFVPQSDLPAQVRGLLPMRRDDFDKRLAGADVSAPASSAGLRLVQAQYTARLEGQDLVGGEAKVEVTAAQGASGPLSLEPCNLALGAGMWQETPPRRAILGIGPRNALTVQVDKSGTLLLPWSRRGQKSPAGALEFDLSLPPAALQQLRLRVPDRLRLTSSEGLVRRSQQQADSGGTAEWVIELGGLTRTRLRIEDESLVAGPEHMALLKEDAQYALTPTNLTAEYQFQIDIHGRSIAAAQLQIDPRLTISTVSVGGQIAPWSVAGDAKARTLSVQMPQPLGVGSHSLNIQAVAEIAGSAPWRLPRIVWPGAVWQEGAATLAVPPTVQLAVSRTSGCRPAKGAPSSGMGENLAFHYYASDGFVELETLPRQPRLSSSLGVTVQFDPSHQVSATLRADLVSQEGDVFETDAVVSNDWVLDAIDTEPADLLEDRPVIAQDERNRTMRLKFARPITPQKPVRLVVRARLQQSSTEEFGAWALWRWWRFPGAIERPAVLALRNNVANYDLQVTGDGDASRIDPEATPGDELDLLDSPPSGLLMRLPPGASDFHVALRQGNPRYTAAWELTAACSRSRLQHQVAVRCTPSGPGLSRLTVQSIPPPDREIRWRVVGAADTAVVAQTRRDTVSPAGGAPAQAVWELEFNRPLTQPFTLESTWESTRSSRQSIPLFTCREATSQTAHVRVTAEDDARWFLAARGLTALPIPVEPEDRFTRTRGQFRYELDGPAALDVVDYGQESLLPLAQVTSAALTTRFAADGSSLDVLTLSLANAGLSELPLDLPPTASLREVAVEGIQVEPQLSGPKDSSLRIPLPDAVREVTVRVSYASTGGHRAYFAGAWRTELPELALACPPLRWNVILPPGIRAQDDVLGNPWQEQLLARFWAPLVPPQWDHWLHPWRAEEPRGTTAAAAAGEGQGSSPEDELALEPGWSLLSRHAAWSPAVQLDVFEPGRWSLFSLSLALFAGGLVLVAPRGSWRYWWLLAIVLAVGVAVAPLVAAWLIAGAFWGLLAGCLTASLRPQPVRPRDSHTSRGSTLRAWTAAGASVLLLSAWLALSPESRLLAQPPRAERPAAGARQIHRVVIPIDEERKPVGDYVFVDAAFYDWLHEQPAGGQPAEPWQIEDAVYEVRWPDDPDGEPLPAHLQVRLEITTFAVDAVVVLPFRRDDLLLEQAGARLDGKPIPVAWEADGRGLSVAVPSPGRYRLDLACSVPLKAAGRQRELTLAIPRAPHALARVSAAPTAPLTSTSAPGPATLQSDATGSTWQVQLGSAAELSLRLASADAAEEQQVAEAEQLLSWKVRPGSVVVDSLCKFRALTGTLREVQVRFDSHLRFVRLEGLPPGATHWVETGPENTLHVVLAEPTAALAVRPRFLLAESSGVGKIVPPRVEAVAGRISRYWLAVSTGPGLELASAPKSSPRISTADFAQAFGLIDGIPAAAFDLAGGIGIPELEFRPEVRTATASAATTLVCGLSLCRLTFEAELTGLSPDHVQQRVVLPRGWTASEVTLRDGDLPLACRWFQQADGTVVVRADQQPGSSQQLRVEATQTLSPGVPLTLPDVKLADIAIAEQSLRIERTYDCAVAVQELVGWSSDGRAVADQPVEGRRRLVAGLESVRGSSERQLTLRISPNNPQVSARMVTRQVGQGSAQAAVNVVCDLDISGGSLDELRLDATPDWSGPWETVPPLAVRSANIPGESRRLVTLIPDRPFTGKVSVSVNSSLRPVAGEPLRVPEINLIDVPQVERLVQLQKPRPQDTSRWRVAFLHAASLPAELQTGPLADPNYDTFAVAGPHFDAVLASLPQASAAPLVSLIEYRAAWLPTGVVQGRALIHLDPSALESCILHFEHGYRPIAALLDGIPAEVVQQEEGRWLVHLPGDRLPQQLDIAYQGSPHEVAEPWSDRRLIHLAGPTLVGLPARATIWSVEAAPPLLLDAPRLEKVTDLVRLDQDLTRLASAAELLARATQRQLSGLSGEALTSWLAPRRAGIAAAARRVEAALRTLVADDGQRQARFRQIQAEFDRLWQSLPGGPPPDRSTSPSSESSLGQQRLLSGVFSGPVAEMQLWLTDPLVRPPQVRWQIALAIFLAGVAAWFLARWSAIHDWLAASPPFAIAVVGIALASLSPLGVAALVLPLAALVMLWRSPWAPRSAERHSSILRREQRSRA